MQPGILLFNDVLGGLKASRDRLVSKDDASGTQLSVCMEKNLRLSILVRSGLLTKLKLGVVTFLFAKIRKRKGIVRGGV